MVDFIAEVEKFIRRRDNGEYIITRIATERFYLYRNASSAIERLANTLPLGDCLASSIRDFIFNRDEKAKLDLAIECYKWINIAWSIGALQEGQGLVSKLEECRTENSCLQQELADLSVKYLDVKGKHEMFEKKFPKLKDKR